MSKKRAPQTEPLGYRLFIDPCNMVVLRAAGDESFLVERNCAMVSKRFRDALTEMEALIPSYFQEEPHGTFEHPQANCYPYEVLSGGSSSTSSPPSRSQRQHLSNDERCALLPFFDMEWELRPHLSDHGKTMFSVEEVLHLRHRQSLEAGMNGSGETSPGMVGTLGSERSMGSVSPGLPISVSFTSPGVPGAAAGSSKGGGRGTVALSTPSGPKRSHIFCMEDEHGIRWYPLFEFPDLSANLLEIAIRYMYLKYKMDSEPEKRVPFHPSLISEGGNAVRLIAMDREICLSPSGSSQPPLLEHPSMLLGSSLSSSASVDIMVADGVSSLLLSEQSSLNEPPSESINELTSSSLLLSSSFSSSVLRDESRRNSGSKDRETFYHSTDADLVSSVEAMSSRVLSARVTVVSPTPERQKEKEDGKVVEEEDLPNLKSDLDHAVVHRRGSPIPSSVSTAPSPLLSSSSSITPLLLEGSSPVQRNVNSTNRRGECCICLARAIYTCPACGKSVCSLVCSRTHKEASFPSCSGLPDPTAKVLLKDYTAVQCSRDIRFLEDCRRVLGSIESKILPGDHHSAYGSGSSSGLHSHALSDGRMLKKEVESASSTSPSDHAHAATSSFSRETAALSGQSQKQRFVPSSVELQKAALRRGIYCVILSPGMARRVANTSKCLPDNRISWRCEFNFYKKEQVAFHLCIDESVETLRLGKILLDCWNMWKESMRSERCGTNWKIEESEDLKRVCVSSFPSDPQNLPLTFPFSPLCANSTQKSEDKEQKRKQVRDNSDERVDAVTLESSLDVDCSYFPLDSSMPARDPYTSALSPFSPSKKKGEGDEDDLESWSKLITKMTKENAQNGVKKNCDSDPPLLVILYKLPRIGVQPQYYYQLSCDETLLDALQRVKVVTEFPTFEVVTIEDLHFFPLTSEEEFIAWKGVVSSCFLKKPMCKSGRVDGKKDRKNDKIGKGEEDHHSDRSSLPGHRRLLPSKRGRGAGGSSQFFSKKRLQREA